MSASRISEDPRDDRQCLRSVCISSPLLSTFSPGILTKIFALALDIHRSQTPCILPSRLRQHFYSRARVCGAQEERPGGYGQVSGGRQEAVEMEAIG
jgi:hypothetical protein